MVIKERISIFRKENFKNIHNFFPIPSIGSIHSKIRTHLVINMLAAVGERDVSTGLYRVLQGVWVK